MDDYSRYVTAVNKIFDYIEKMRAGWNNLDNKNYIDSIDDFKSIVTSKAELIKKPPTVEAEKSEDAPSTSVELNLDVNTDENKEAEKDELELDIGLEEEDEESEEEKEDHDVSTPITSFAPSQSSGGPSVSPGIRGLEELSRLDGLSMFSEAPPLKKIEKPPGMPVD